jgi:hypothetical protein
MEIQKLPISFSWSRHVSFLAYSPLHNDDSFQAIALFNANQHEEAILRVRQLATACPDADTLACSVVEVSIIYSTKPRFVD